MVSYFPPDRIGGVGEAAAHLHEGLLDVGHDSTVLTAGHTKTDPRVLRIASSPAGFLLALAHHARSAREYDLIHCHQGDAVLLLLALQLRASTVPVLVSMHVGYRGMAAAFQPYQIEGHWFARDAESWRYRHVKARLNDWAGRLVLRLASDAAFISRSAAVDNLGVEKAAAAEVVYNGLPRLTEGSLPSALPEPVELLFVGVAGHRKRVTSLPFVLERVRQRVPGARLRLIGFELEAEPELYDFFRGKGLLDAVVCEGRLRSEEIRPFYRAAKVLLVPSAYEGLPMVILEAFQLGLPCVATRVSGHPEVIEDGRNGFLVDLDRPEQMAERCIRILAEPGLRQRLSLAAEETVRLRFTLEQQVSEYLALYRRLAAGPS